MTTPHKNATDRGGGLSGRGQPNVALPRAGVALPSPFGEPSHEFMARAKAAWARLIRKVYEADPLACPKCKGPMRVIALIEDAGVAGIS